MQERDNLTLAGAVRAAALGGLAWAIYAIVYFSYFFLIPYLVQPAETLILPRQWKLAGTHIVIYFAIGAIAGTITWAILTRLLRRFGRSPAPDCGGLALTSSSLSLLFALGVTLIASEIFGKRELFLLVIVIGLLGVLAAGCKLDPARRRLDHLLDPWIVCAALVGTPWIWTKGLVDTSLEKALAPLVLILVALAFSLAVSAVFKFDFRGDGVSFVLRQTIVCGAIFALAAGIAYWLGAKRPGAKIPAPAQEARADRPDVVLIVLDTVRRDHLSVYGYGRPTTPRLERFAQSATVYKRAIASSNMTLPTHASMFTGLYASRHGAHYMPPDFPFGNPLAGRHQTLAESLRDRGYRTAAVVANHHYLDAHYGFNQGFAVYDDRARLETSRAESGLFLHGLVSRILPAELAIESERLYRTAGEINSAGFQLLESMSQDDHPFFLFLNYMDAHHPYVPPAPFNTLFPGRDLSLNLYRLPAIRDEVMGMERPMTGQEASSILSQYDGAIAYMDAKIDEVVTRLRGLGRLDNSLIIVTSDHGEAVGEHHEIGHGGTMYHTQVAIPLVIKYPRQAAGRIVNELVAQVDLFPTVLDVARIAIPDGIDGLSLLNVEESSNDWVVMEAFQSPAHDGVAERFRSKEAGVIQGRTKLILSEVDGAELYDVIADPGERHDLYTTNTEYGRELESILRDWQASLDPPMPARQVPESSEILKRLRSLGYVQ